MKLAGFSSLLLATLLVSNGVAQNLSNTNRKIASVEATLEQLNELSREGYIIDHPHDGRAEIWLDDSEFNQLSEIGFQVRWERNLAQEQWARQMELGRISGNPAGDYHNYAEVTTFLQNLATTYPDLCRVESLGQTVQGREIWAIKITDNPDVEEQEPEFKYIATIHGDEPIGTELLLSLANDLLSQHGTSSRLTNLVDNSEIWFVPMMNPDGNALGQRFNAHGVDLNRDFPDLFDDPNNTTVGREPEVVALMNFCNAHNFVLSANFHSGSLVVNYPYDSPSNGNNESTYPCPDDDIFRTASLAYSIQNQPMFSSTEFTQGITVGAAWYIVFGGMQDWNYNYAGCREVTIELDYVKWPDDSELPRLQSQNRESMLRYMERMLQGGVKGKVTNAANGEPLRAKISVAGRDSYAGHDINFYSDGDVGDYNLMLLGGNYDITYEVDGYAPKTLFNVSVSTSTAITRNMTFGVAPTPTPTPTPTANEDIWTIQ